MKKIILIIVFALLSLTVFFVFQYFQSGKYITVNYENVKQISLVEYRTSKQVHIFDHSGDRVYIRKDTRYQLRYTGTDGYASDVLNIDNSKDTVSIKPYYSDKKLESILDSNIESIRTAIKKSYPNVDKNYTMQRGKLYYYGDWYSTSFVYKKGYDFDSDTLHIVLRKSNGTWRVATEPGITLDRFTNPTVPVDILREINNP